MTNGKKILVSICAILILFAIGFFSGFAVRKTIDSKRIAEYRNTIDSLGSQIIAVGETNTELTENNNRITGELESLRTEYQSAILRAGKAEDLIAEISKGISGTSGDVREIIRSIRIVIEKIESLGVPK